MNNYKVYIYGGCLFDEHPKDFDIIVETDKDIKTILSNLEYTLNSFGGAKVVYKNNTFDIAVVRNLDDKVFYDRFAELDSDCVVYDLSNKKEIQYEHYKSYIKNGYARVINEENLHPKLGIVRRLQRINKANNRKEHKCKIHYHLSLLENFIKNLNL